jgi:hypothetical protein
MAEDYNKIVVSELEYWVAKIEIESVLISRSGGDSWTARGWSDHGSAPIKIWLGWEKSFWGKPYQCFHVTVSGIYWRTRPMKMSNGWRREATKSGYKTCKATAEDLHKTMQELCKVAILLPDRGS